MDIHYKIIEVHPNEHSIVVRYYTDKLTEDKLATFPEAVDRRLDGSPIRCRTDYNINIPIPAPKDEKLEEFIMSKAPVYWLDMQEKIMDPDVDTTLSDFKDLVNVKKTISIDLTPPPEPVTEIPNSEQPSGIMTDDDILELLEKAKQGKAAG
jgi:hypothetical protein